MTEADTGGGQHKWGSVEVEQLWSVNMVLLWSNILSLGQKHSWNLGKILSLDKKILSMILQVQQLQNLGQMQPVVPHVEISTQ